MRAALKMALGLALGLSAACGRAPAAQETAAAEKIAVPAPPNVLWEIGAADNSTQEFALAPAGYQKYSRGGYFVVGHSAPNTDWPYVHPGPEDAWAADTSKVFTILFMLANVPQEGECRLHIDFAGVHAAQPPELNIYINGTLFPKQLSPGSSGDGSLGGDVTKEMEQNVFVAFPAALLRPGENVINLMNAAGSWMLYDWIGLETPPGAALGGWDKPIVHITNLQPLPFLTEKEGVLHRSVQLGIRNYGAPFNALLRFADRPPQSLSLADGVQQVQIEIPAQDAVQPVVAEILANDAVVARREAVLPAPRRWIVYLMHHTHLDIGYTHLQSDVEQIQWRHIDTAMDLIRQTADYPPEARFKWLPEGLWAVESYLNQAAPEQREAFIAAVKSGAIGLDALYANELTALCRPDELIELTGYARRFSRQHGIAIDTAMISDVPGYTWGIIPVLAQSGVKYFSIGPNATHRIGYTLSEWGEKPFYWKTPAGDAKVLCWIAGKAYSWFHAGPIGDAAQVVEYLTELEARAYPYDIVQVRYSIGGDNGGPDPALPGFVKQWNERYVAPKLVIATTREAFVEFEKRYGAALPVESGDFTPYWEDGAASSARETAQNRAAAERLSQANALWAMLNPGPYPAADFQAAWRNVLLYDEHTWGAHNSISEPESDFAKGQWAVKQAFAVQAEKQSQALLARALEGVRADAPVLTSFAVFNTASWSRSDLVLLPKKWLRAGDMLMDAQGNPVPAQVLSTGELAFVAKQVPPYGALRYRLQAGPATAQGSAQATATTLSNGLLSLEIDPDSGAIASVKRNGQEADLVDRSKGPGLNDYLYVAGRDPKEPKRNGKPVITIKEPGPLVASLSIQSPAPGCAELTRELRLVSDLDYAEIVNVLDKKNIYEAEAVHLAFPFLVPDGLVRMDIPFAVVTPESGQLRGACKNYFTVQRWVDVSNEDYGVTWAILDAPLIEIGAPTNDARVVGWIQKLDPAENLYSYVMNNYWETNYKASQEGVTTFRYAIKPHGPYDPVAAQRYGMGYSQPLIAVPVAEDAALPAPLINSLPSGVVASALKPSDDGQGVILRLFNPTEQPQPAWPVWSGPTPKSVDLSNVSEDPGVPLQETELRPWQWITLRIAR